MSTLRTADGFEFQTTRSDRTFCCGCKRHGVEVFVVYEPAPEGDPSFVQTELLELMARNLWIAGRHMRRLNSLRRKGESDETL